MYVCFFFQAEDGIRDLYVTGVQTCALPIYGRTARAERFETAQDLVERHERWERRQPDRAHLEHELRVDGPRRRGERLVGLERSEERRVGKECRSRRRM